MRGEMRRATFAYARASAVRSTVRQTLRLTPEYIFTVTYAPSTVTTA